MDAARPFRRPIVLGILYGNGTGKSAISKVIVPSAVRHKCYYDVIKHECRMARVFDNLRLHKC